MTIQSYDDSLIPEDLPLWRYMDLAKFLDLISTRELAMPLAYLMEDPYEGDIGDATAAARWHSLKAQGAPSYVAAQRQELERGLASRLRSATWISCWNSLNTESAAMWKLYGGQRGVAVRTTWEALRDSLRPTRKIFSGLVSYLDYAHESTETDTFTDDYFFKRSSFSFEHEFRLVAHAGELNGHLDLSKVPQNVPWPQVLRVPVDIERLIHEVYLNPLEEDWLTGVLDRVSAQFGGNWVVTKSSLYDSRGPNYWPK